MEMSPKSVYCHQISNQIQSGETTFEVMIEFHDSYEAERNNLINDFLKITSNINFDPADTMRIDNSRLTRRYVFCKITKKTMLEIVNFYKDYIIKIWNDNEISAFGGAC